MEFHTFQVTFLLELDRASIPTVDVFVYDRNDIFLPNYLHLHGSAYNELQLFTQGDPDEYSLFRQEMEITRTKWKSLDKDSERCSQTHRKKNTEKCITRYIQQGYSEEQNDIFRNFYIRYLEGLINCSFWAKQADKSREICDEPEHFDALLRLNHIMQNSDETKLYEETGCLFSCEKFEYELHPKSLKRDDGVFCTMFPELEYVSDVFHIDFYFKSGDYMEFEQV